jgi:AMP-activated protein kinase-like protein
VRLVPVVFRLPSGSVPNARRVSVVGSFNHWDSTAHALTRSAEGDWATTIYLPPGRIVYLYSVDGASRADPYDDGRVPSGWGFQYSVRYVREANVADRGRLLRSRPSGLMVWKSA